MPTTEKLRNKLLQKLSELFQLDQPDLDFGFYRIMQSKALQVKTFIDKDLLQYIQDAFGQVDEERKAELQTNIDHELEVAKAYGVPDPEKSPKVMEAKAKYEALRDGATAEADVYDHLYRFFERYYDDGDFISRRYYARESAGKAAPFAIPYNGEEVKLHWANADQYYVKTAEYFSNYSFDITQAAEIRKMSSNEKVMNGIPDKPLKVHFRIIDASEGAHGDVKESEDKKRFFILYDEKPVEFNEANELVINFKYKSLPGGKNEVDDITEIALTEKYGRSLNKGDMPNLAIAEKVISAVLGVDKDNEYLDILKYYAPTDKIPKRPLLAKYINQYTARNTRDYFIHKDLGGFLKRELDFYIKNEVMRLDDIENAEAPVVESYLAKIKVIRKIATKLIDFLAQFEDFQKKLWLKKKFVTETNYCITLDRIPEDLYGEIAANDAQRKEWVDFFSIDEIGASNDEKKAKSIDLFEKETISYTVPLTVEFLKANDKLVLDTFFFTDAFKAKLIESIDNFDEQCDGLLIHSENFQALNLLQERYREQAGCIYIDPPYNSPSSEIVYKNSYKHSSWLTLMNNRIIAAQNLQNNRCSCVVAIDENEGNGLQRLMYEVFQNWDVPLISIEHNKKGIQGDHFSFSSEFAIFAIPRELKKLNRTLLPESEWEYSNLRNWGSESLRTDGRNCFYPIFVRNGEVIGFGEVSDEEFHPLNANIVQPNGVVAIYPIDSQGVERKWRYARDTVESIRELLKIETARNGDFQVMKAKADEQFKTLWYDSKYNAGDYGTKVLTNMGFDKSLFDFPKSIFTVRDCIFAVSGSEDLIVDYFAGSGTTGHAVINLNREDKEINPDSGNRKYILVEMGDYFDTVTKPRISKVIYSLDWINAKPMNHKTGISHCFKYIRLESYEDTLNNLVFDDNPIRSKTVESNPSLKEDYMLHYLLDVETRGSQSLLNIDGFTDPTSYTLNVKKSGSDVQVTRTIDLIETFNYLLGLRLENMAAPQTFTANFTRKPDPELPEDQHTKLVVDGKIQLADDGKWWFRKVEGWLPADRMNPNNGIKERVLIVWRKLTGNLEEDNLMLDEWFEKYRISTRDFEYDTIYINGSNNLPNLKKDDENWKVRLIEEEFHKRMWETGGEA